ncbi:hypothetical protein PM082_021954 [Marasmius tenuissimus]|nr:hypothetical protein PM082_021954 [Marasmius tenuissimus]
MKCLLQCGQIYNIVGWWGYRRFKVSIQFLPRWQRIFFQYKNTSSFSLSAV